MWIKTILIRSPHIYGSGIFLTLITLSLVAVFYTASNVRHKSYAPVESAASEAGGESILKRIDELSNAGLLQYEDGNTELALILLETAGMLSGEPLKNIYLEALDDAYLISGEYKRSMELSKQLIEYNPENAGYYRRLGLGHLGVGNINSAIEEFNRALQLDENDRSAMLYLVLAYNMQGNRSKTEEVFRIAEEQYQQVLSLNEYDVSSLLELTTLYIYMEQNLDKASGNLVKAREVVLNDREIPSSELLLNFYIPMLEGMILYLKNDYYKSLTQLTHAVENTPSGAKGDLAKIYFFIGKDYASLRKPLHAKRFYNKSLGLDPHIIYAKEIKAYLRN